jgi:hypothetical protein
LGLFSIFKSPILVFLFFTLKERKRSKRISLTAARKKAFSGNEAISEMEASFLAVDILKLLRTQEVTEFSLPKRKRK